MKYQVVSSFTVKTINNEINFAPEQLIEIEPKKAEALIETRKLKPADGSALFRKCCQRISKQMQPGDIIKLQRDSEFNNKLETMEGQIVASIKQGGNTQWIIKKYEGFIVNALNSNY